MRLIAAITTRNSAWCLAATVRAVLRWTDAAIIHDHSSTDGTPQIIDQLRQDFPGRIVSMQNADPVWREMSIRQAMLERARTEGATHLALVDDDEMLSENLVSGIRSRIESLSPGEVLQIPWVILWRSLKAYRSDDCIWSRAYVSMAVRDEPNLHWTTRDGYDHHHRHPHSSTHRKEGELSGGGLLHFQHADWLRLCAKQAHYKIVETVRWGGTERFSVQEIDDRYNPTVNEDGLKLTDLPADWIPPELAQVNLHAISWQIKGCRDLMEEHGRGRFAGLNLFGVA